MDADETEAANEHGNVVSQTLAFGALRQELLFVLRDEVNVLLNVTLWHVAPNLAKMPRAGRQ
jgi:hypothetical protein